jgi:hypothetical protein
MTDDSIRTSKSAGKDTNDAAGEPAPRVGRRKMILGVAAAGVGASVVAETEPAGATDGNPVLIGEPNTAKATTSVTTTVGNGLEGSTSAKSQSGVEGVDSSSGGGFGLHGTSKKANGVYGVSVDVSGLEPGVLAGVWGDSTTHAGVVGTSNDSDGVAGYTQGTGQAGVLGSDESSSGGYGLYGSSTNGTGVTGIHSTGNGTGVSGIDNSGLESSHGVSGSSGSGYGVYGTTDNGFGVYGTCTGENGYGVNGNVAADSSIALYGYATGEYAHGVSGNALGTGESYGVYAYSENSDSLYVDGKAAVTGTLSKGGGSFKIDHPLDPGGKYLYHSFVESPDMMNVYNGTVTLHDNGQATVELPDWFEALNRDYRYQLTAIGSPGPELHISREVKDGKFSIAGGKAEQKVSWQVTGIRQDAWANANRIPVEVDKPEKDQGRYLHPELVDGGEPITAIAKAREHTRRIRHTPPT